MDPGQNTPKAKTTEGFRMLTDVMTLKNRSCFSVSMALNVSSCFIRSWYGF